MTHDAGAPRMTRTMREQGLIERRYGRPWWEVLGHLLWIEGLTQEQAGQRLGKSRDTVSRWARDERVRNYGRTDDVARGA